MDEYGLTASRFLTLVSSFLGSSLLVSLSHTNALNDVSAGSANARSNEVLSLPSFMLQMAHIAQVAHMAPKALMAF